MNIKKSGIILLFILGCNFLISAQNSITVKEENNRVYFENNKVKLGFDLESGYFQIKNDRNETVVDKAYFQAGGLQSKDKCEKRTWSVNAVSDSLGTGKTLSVKIAFRDYADIIWQVSLYDNTEFIVFNMGINNDTRQPYRLMCFYPLVSKQVYEGKDVKSNYRILDGNGGGSPTWVSNNAKLCSFNNLMVRFGDPKQPEILVAGGLSYREFEKFVRVDRSDKSLQIQMYSEDPVGKKIDAGKEYLTNEKFYLCFINQNPFEALEKYAGALKKEQQIQLNYYDFPTECLWYAAYYNNDPTRAKFNNSKGAVEEMDNALKSGVTNYSKVAIRLVPDAYGPNNQQGWWDDKHWAMYNEKMSTDLPHYTEPYLTTESWSKAIIGKGGYSFTYMQTGRRSEDFVAAHPDWMLFNDPYRPVIGRSRLVQEQSYPSEFSSDYSGHWWADKVLWGYDFTDPGFIRHMQEVYSNLKKAGIKGIFYDYPEPTAWAYEGGFEDQYATTASAYRQVFRLAYEGLGKEALLQERNVIRGSDITLGLVSSQRVWGDTDGITPEMVSRCGLRWYKNRVVINYDMDSKDPEDALPRENNDGNRSMLTMCYVTSGRFLLGRSFIQLSPQQLHDFTRTFPYHTSPQSARPIDAFDENVKFPRIYDFEINPGWHQLTFYNHNLDSTQAKENNIAVWLSKSLNEGGLGLDGTKQYYVYDFWNNHFIGLVNGNEQLRQSLRLGETRMMSVHAKTNHPQFISTNRHIMQGYVDLKDVEWSDNGNTLSGMASVAANDPYTIVIATNGYQARQVKVNAGKAIIEKQDQQNGLIAITIRSPKNGEIQWKVNFSK